MKNLKINTKFIVCFGLILVLFLVSVIATCSGIVYPRMVIRIFMKKNLLR